MGRKKTHSQFIIKARKIHPNLDILGEYVNNKTKILVRNKYGVCSVTPDKILQGRTPSIMSAVDKSSYFTNKAIEVHGNKYDYSKVEYINNKTKVCIICPIHGEFWQTPDCHLANKGCVECSGNKKSNSSEFIDKSIRLHGDKYDYSKVNYVSSKTKVCIICPIHGEFWQKPNGHLSGDGCKKCGNSYTLNDFIKKATFIHKNKYDYSKVVYVDSKTKVTIICPVHGEFTQIPADHLRNRGCVLCKPITHSRSSAIENAEDKLVRLYKIYCWNETESFYKIGRTKFLTKERFPNKSVMPYNYSVVSELIGDAGYIYDLENKEHRRHYHLKYKPNISFAGETECFTKLL